MTHSLHFNYTTKFNKCFYPKLLLLSLIIIGLLLSFKSKAQINSIGLPFSKYYSSQDYEGGIQNLEITQSLDGVIHVANNFGMLSFDGVEWTINELKAETKCRHINVANNGRIYTASQGDFGYLSINEIGNYVYNSLSEDLPEEFKNFDETWRVFIEQDRILFCTFDYIFYFNIEDELIKIVETPTGVDDFFFVGNRIYINQKEKGVLRETTNGFEPIAEGDFFINKSVTNILKYDKNSLLINTLDEGIFLVSDMGVKIWNENTQDIFTQFSIKRAIRLSNGNFAIGSLDGGLLVTTKKGEIIKRLTKGHGLQNRTVLSLFEDMQNNLWLGHNNGISRIEFSNPFSFINEQSELPGTGYDALLTDDLLYLGTNNGLFAQKSDSSIIKVNESRDQVYEISSLKNLVVVGQHSGSYVINDKSVDLASDIPGAWTFISLKNHPGYVLQGNYKGLALFKIEANTLLFVRKLKGFSESSRLLHQTSSGDIWMTHGYKGVFKFKISETLDSVAFKYYGKDKGLPSNLLVNVWRINNTLLFTTKEGIYQYNKKEDNFQRYTFFDEYLPKDIQIISMAEDPIGNIYYSSTSEIGVLEKSGNGVYKKQHTVFNRIKRLLNDDLQKIIPLEANRILFTAKEGFIHYTHDSKNRNAVKLKTLIKRVTVTGKADSVISFAKYAVNNQYTLNQPDASIPDIPYENNSVHFSYAAPFMVAHDKTEYSYWLEYSEADQYSNWSTSTEKEYTNLREGQYIFHVLAKDIYGNKSEETTYTFNILAPWYRSTAAYAIYTISSVIIIFFAILLTEKRYQTKTRIITVEKERELNKKNTALKSSEQLIDKLKNDKLKAKIDIQNKELATSTMLIINKNEFISSVRGNLNSVIKSSKNQEVKHKLSKIISNIEKNITSDKDWENFALHFDKVHGDFTTRFKSEYPNMSPQEMKLSAYLRMNLSTKEIAHLLNISIRGVEIARYRLRKKLNLERANNLQEFILRY